MTRTEAVLLEELGTVIGIALVLFRPVLISLAAVLLVGVALRRYRHPRQWARACPCGTPLRSGRCASCGRS